MTRTAVITGSTSGIGLGLAETFAGAGFNIMLNGLGEAAEIERIRAGLASRHSVEIAYHGADMRDGAQIEALIREAEEKFGQIDVLINNAGIQHVAPVEDFPLDKWDDVIAVNFTSAFHTIRCALPAMKARKSGRIINIASAHGLAASPFKSAYVSAKHAMIGLTRTVALEVAEENITVNAICPGYVRTPLVDAQIPDTAKARGLSEDQVIKDVILAAQPTKQFVTIEQIGAFALFLSSDEAAQVTGAALSMDGGWTAR